MRLVTASSFCPLLLLAQQPIIQPNGTVFGANGMQRMTPATSDCSVDGVVVNKISGEFIPRARVMLTGNGGQSSTAADNAGHFAFSNASCGQIQLIGNRPGFLPGVSGGAQPGGGFHPTVLAAGSSLHDARVELVPQAVVTGKVIDELGDPEPNAQVSALVSRVVQGRRGFQAGMSTLTNDLGEFRLANLQRGKYILCTRGTSRFGSTGDTISGETCYPGPVEAGAASAMEIMPGSEMKMDFTIHKVHAVHVRGTITGLPKNQGVGLNLIRRAVQGGIAGNHPAAIQPDGKFDIADVAPGSYTLSTDYFEAGKRLTARVPIDVGSSDIDNVAVRLEPGLSVSGTVRYESRSGATPGPQQFNINLHSPDMTVGGGGVQWGKDHTTFTVPDLPPGTYRLDAFINGKWHLKSALLGGRDLSREDVVIGPGAGMIDVVLSDESGSIEGQVTDAADQPMPSWVMVIADGGQPRNVFADATGNFKIAGLAPGDYQIYAWDDVQQVEYANPDWMRRFSGSSVSIQADQAAQVKLKQMSVDAH